MNFELTVAESFDSSWSLLQSLHINFLTSNSCECPHRLLDLIVKERDSLGCRGMRILRFPDSESSTFYRVRSGAFRPGWHRCSVLRRVRALPCQRGGIIGTSNFRATPDPKNIEKGLSFACFANRLGNSCTKFS